MRFFLFSFILFLSACGGVQGRIDKAQHWQQKSGYKSVVLRTAEFPLYSAQPNNFPKQQDIIKIVIEGDGYIAVSRSQLSGDPTPKNPVGLKIATATQSLYLARPCQFVRNARCDRRYWSVDRFAPEVLRAYDDALDHIKARYGTPQSKLHLIGFSGGAYIALNSAARRDDIAKVTTIAGLIGPEDWTAHHDITPLNVTSRASTLLQQTSGIAFTHICSNSDKTLPCTLTRRTLGRAPNHTIINIPGHSHEELWAHAIPYL